MKLNSAFHRLFLLREGKVILGKRWVNLIVVFIILLATFFALGLSNGSTNYLNKKMDNPFNKWVYFHTELFKDNNEMDTLLFYLNKVSDRYHIKQIDTSYYRAESFLLSSADKCDEVNAQDIFYITLDQESSLFQFLIEDPKFQKSCKDHSLIKNDFNNSYGIIIKRKILDRLGLKNSNPKYLRIWQSDSFGNDFFNSIPILGVLDDIPFNVSFIANLKTHNFLMVPKLDYNSLKLFSENNVNKSKIENELNVNLSLLNDSIFKESYIVEGDYYEITNDSIDVESLSNNIIHNYAADDVHIVVKHSFIKNRIKTAKQKRSDFISLFLTDLDSLRSLKKYLDDFPIIHNFENKKERVINIDISSVESLENLHFISELTKVLSIFLLLFSMFSIILFLVNIINAHFEKIKQNIGTLKAFGLSNQKLIGNYIFIYMLIIFSASLFAFFFANLMGQSGMAVFIFNLLDITIEEGETCFHLFNMKGLGAFVIILILAMGVVYYKLLKILRSTPGDLIFER